MVDVYFDSGTSNSRAYLIQSSSVMDVIDTIDYSIGSKDSSITGSNQMLVKGLKHLYDNLLNNNNILDEAVHHIYASGMVTSPFGIKEVPHISTPVSLELLCKNIVAYYEPDFFKRDIHLIRGVKTIAENYIFDPCLMDEVNNMRGEEVELFGILAQLETFAKTKNIAVFLPGSHTHIVYAEKGEIKDILSTFSGELYHAVSTSTILADSIRSTNDELDEEMVLLGFRDLKEYGITRALYIAHATKIFNVCNNHQRQSYLEGVINGSVVQAFDSRLKNKWSGINKILIASNSTRIARIYEILLKEMQNEIGISIMIASERQGFAVKGFMEILKMIEQQRRMRS
jgi:2-dehydro-3-deoxygalactonokinase